MARIAPMFEQAFRNIDDALRKEAGCATELDYAEQTSWLLFLKYLDALAAETQWLTRLYEQKQAALAALKKSLLHQAFSGAL